MKTISLLTHLQFSTEPTDAGISNSATKLMVPCIECFRDHQSTPKRFRLQYQPNLVVGTSNSEMYKDVGLFDDSFKA